jgi:hypothetical protein
VLLCVYVLCVCLLKLWCLMAFRALFMCHAHNTSVHVNMNDCAHRRGIVVFAVLLFSRLSSPIGRNYFRIRT